MANFRVIVTMTQFGPGWTVTKYNGSTSTWNTLISYTISDITGTDTYPNYLWPTAALNLSSGDVVSWKISSLYSGNFVYVSGLSTDLWTDSASITLTTTYQHKTVKSNNTNNRDLVTAAQWASYSVVGTLTAHFQDYIEPDQTMTVSAPSNVFSTDTSFNVAISGATVGDVVKIMTVPGNVQAGSLFINSTGSLNVTATSQLPATGASQNYKLVVYRTDNTSYDGKGTSYIINVTNGTFTVSKVLKANTAFSYTSTVALSPPVTGFTVTTSASVGSFNTSVTSYRLVLQGTSTAVSAAVPGFGTLTSTDVPAVGTSKTYQIQTAISAGNGGTGGWTTVPGVNIVVTVASYLIANTSFSYTPQTLTLAQNATGFTVTTSVSGSSTNTDITSYRLVLQGTSTAVSAAVPGFGTLTSTDVPADGASKTYQIQTAISTGNGGTGGWGTVSGANVVVTAGTWPDVTVTTTSNITIDDQDATFPIVISGTSVDTHYRVVETNSIGSTASGLGVSGNATTTSLTLTMPSQQVTTIPADTDFPAGTTRWYKIQGKVTAANGGNNTYYNTTSSSVITVYKLFRVPDTTITVAPSTQNAAYDATSFNINVTDIGSPTTDSAWTQYRVCINSTGAVIAGADRLGPGVIAVGHVPSTASVTYKIQASAPTDDNSKGDGSWSNIVGNTFTVNKLGEIFHGFQHLNDAGTVVVDSTKPTKTVIQIDSDLTITLAGGGSPVENYSMQTVAGVSSTQDLEDNYIFERVDNGGISQIFSGSNNTFNISYDTNFPGKVKFQYNAVCTSSLNGNPRTCTSTDIVSNTFDIFVVGKTL